MEEKNWKIKIGNNRQNTKKVNRKTRKFNKMSAYKINNQKSIVSKCEKSRQLEDNMEDKIQFTIDIRWTNILLNKFTVTV